MEGNDSLGLRIPDGMLRDFAYAKLGYFTCALTRTS